MAERVPHGQIGTGEAQIFGGPSDPLKAFQYAQTKQDQIAANKAANDASKKKARDEAVKEAFDYNPEATWEPFNEQVSDSAKGYFDWYVDKLNKGQDVSDVEFQKEAKGRRMQIDNMARRGNFLKDERKQFIDEFVDGDRAKYYKTDQLMSQMNDVYYDNDMNGLPLASIKKDSLYAISDNVDLFNMQTLSKDIMSGIQTKMIQDEVLRSKNEDGVHITSDAAKSKLFKLNDNGTVNFKDINPEIIGLVKEDPQMARYLEVKAGGDAEKEKQLIRDLFTPFDPTSQVNNQSVSSRSSGGAGRFSDIQLNVNNDPDYKEYGKVRSDGVAGRGSITVDIPGMAKGVLIKNDQTGQSGKYDLHGFGVDAEGNAYIKGSSKLKGVDFDENLPYTPANVTMIRNTLTKPDERKEFDKIVSEFNSARKDQKTFIRDDSRLESTVDNIMTSAFKGSNSEIQNLLSNLGFADATVTSGSPGWLNSQWVSINGNKFYHSQKQKLVEYIYDNARDIFTYEKPSKGLGGYVPSDSDESSTPASSGDKKDDGYEDL